MDGVQLSRERALREEKHYFVSPADLICYTNYDPEMSYMIPDIKEDFGNSLSLVPRALGTELAAIAPVRLPHGAVIKSMTVDAYTNTWDYVYTWLIRKTWAADTKDIMAYVEHQNENGRFQYTDATINYAKFDLQSYFYYINIVMMCHVDFYNAQWIGAKVVWE